MPPTRDDDAGGGGYRGRGGATVRAKGPPRRLRYGVPAASSEDVDHPARDLLAHHPGCQGWASGRFVRFPQEVTLRLQYKALVHEVQVVTHEFLVPSAIELFVQDDSPPGPSGRGGAPGEWRFLGQIFMDDNARTGYTARELKVIHLDEVATSVKLRFQRAHPNTRNIYNQVGVVAATVVGWALEGAGDKSQAGAPMLQGLMEHGVDAEVMEIIRKAHLQKEVASQREDYDTAKQLKLGIQRLKQIGTRVAQLEAQKVLAVQIEDFARAKTLKADIDKLRRQCGQLSIGPESIKMREYGEAAAHGFPETPLARLAGPPSSLLAGPGPQAKGTGSVLMSERGKARNLTFPASRPVAPTKGGADGDEPEPAPKPKAAAKAKAAEKEDQKGDGKGPEKGAKADRPAEGASEGDGKGGEAAKKKEVEELRSSLEARELALRKREAALAEKEKQLKEKKQKPPAAKAKGPAKGEGDGKPKLVEKKPAAPKAQKPGPKKEELSPFLEYENKPVTTHSSYDAMLDQAGPGVAAKAKAAGEGGA